MDDSFSKKVQTLLNQNSDPIPFEEQFPSLKGKVSQYGPGDDGTPEIYDCLLDARDEDTHFSYGDGIIRHKVVQKYCLDKQRVREVLDNVFGTSMKCVCNQIFEGECDYCIKKNLVKELGL